MKSGLLFAIAASAITAAVPKQALFVDRRDYTPGAQVVRVADVNGDKILDLLGVYEFANTGVTTFLGDGNGLFRAGPTSQIGIQGLAGLAALDLNGDGKVDLIVSGFVNANLMGPVGLGVSFGNGDGTFQAAVFYPVSDSYVNYLEMGDFNGDGIPDAVIAGAAGVWLFIGRGGGIFSPGVLTPIPGTALGQIATADFNGDGHLDLAVTYNIPPASNGATGSSGFVLLLGNGDGTFQTLTIFDIPPHGVFPAGVNNWIAVGDLNKDGHPDIVLSPDGLQQSGTIYPYVNVLLNNGNGGFLAPTHVNIDGALSIAVGDVNGDGIPDLVNSLGTVAFGEGNGKFLPPVSYAVEGNLNSYDVVLADLRHKGVLDIVAAQYMAISVLLNFGDGKFEESEWVSVPGSGSCAAAADFNGDGKPDLAVPTTNGMVILLGTGNGSAPYITGATIPLSGPGCPIAGDLNGDGIPDILEGANSLGGLGAYLGNGDGTFTLASITTVESGSIVTGDFNRDGKLDFADSSNQLALGNGDGTFQPPVNIVPSAPLGFNWIAAGDINNDGWTDLLATQWEYKSLYVLVNNQQGGFTQSTITNDGGPQGVALADLNLDGKLDAVVWLTGGTSALVYLGDGLGGFKLLKQEIPYPGADTQMLYVGDVNGDGIPDLLLPADGSLGIAYGNGKGLFTPAVAWGVGASAGQILLENLHGQPASANLPDIVSPDGGGGVTVLLNITQAN